MARAITRLASLPGPAQSTATTLATLDFPEGRWAYVPEHPLVADGRGVQVRDIAEKAPPKKVAHYVDMMRPYTKDRSGLPFPPVVYTRDGYLLDGNTRNAAAEKLKWSTFPAIVLNDDYHDAPQILRDQFTAIMVRFNMIHGERLSSADLERHILAVARPDDSPRDIANRLQVSVNTVKDVLAARNAKERLDGLGLSLDPDRYPHITRSHFSQIGHQLSRWHDEPLAAYVELLKAKTSSVEAYTLQRDFLKLTSDEDIVKAIDVERASRRARGQGLAQRPSRAAQLRQHLGFTLKYEPGDLVEIEPGNMEAHRASIENAITRLQRVYLLQSDLIKSRAEGVPDAE